MDAAGRTPFPYVAENIYPAKTAIYVGDLYSKERRLLFLADAAAHVEPGYLLFTRERTLIAQPFDATKAQAAGSPLPIAENLDTSPHSAAFSASQNGVLVYSAGTEGGDVQLTWFDRSGTVVGTLGSRSRWLAPSISPDGSFVVATSENVTTRSADLTLFDLARGTSSQFAPYSFYGVWSPDGKYIAFQRDRMGTGPDTVVQRATSGNQQEKVLDQGRTPTDWSRDGHDIIEMGTSPNTGVDIRALPLLGDRKPFPYLNDQFDEGYAKLSPNGRWIAYPSNPTKRYEIYVQAFPTPGERWQVSVNGGDWPAWSRDGKELFFVDPENRMMAVQVNDGERFDASAPKPLFDTGMITGSWFDVSKDGRFLIPNRKSGGTQTMNIIVNWPAALRQ